MDIKKIALSTMLVLTFIVGQNLIQGIGRLPTNVEQYPILDKLKNNNWTADEVKGSQIAMYIDWTPYDTLEKLCQDADIIVLCKGVNKIYASNVYEGTTIPNIMTYVNLDVEKIYKGTAGKTIVVEQMGGTYNGLTAVSNDVSEIKLNQPLILFLNIKEGNAYRLTGGPQGMFAISNGKVYSIGEIDTKVSKFTSQLNLLGMELTTFENQLTK